MEIFSPFAMSLLLAFLMSSERKISQKVLGKVTAFIFAKN